MSEQNPARSFRTVSGLSHTAIRTRDLPGSVRFYSEVLGLPEAFVHAQQRGDVNLGFHAVGILRPTGFGKASPDPMSSDSAISA